MSPRTVPPRIVPDPPPDPSVFVIYFEEVEKILNFRNYYVENENKKIT